MAYSDNSIFMHSIKAKVPRSLFDLSHVVDTTLEMGDIIPVYLQDCVPNDTMTISNDILVRAMPMVTPLLSRVKIYTDYYFVPYAMLWKNFEDAISGGRLGTYTAPFPQFKPLDVSWTQPGTLWDYFGFQTGVIPADPDLPSAFPFAAYQRIYRDYYLNHDIQDAAVASVFNLDSNVLDFTLIDGIQNEYGANASGTRPYLGSVNAHNLRKDYFTTAKPSPQRGVAPSIPLSGSGTVSNLDVTSPFATEAFVTGDSQNGYNYSHLVSSVMGSVQSYGTNGILEGNVALRPGVKYNVSGGNVDFSQAGTFTVDDLRLITQLQLWLERNMRVEARYKEFLQAHFDSAPVDERLTRPAYIGGTVQSLVVSEVLQTSESTDTSAQGTMTGHGISRNNGYVGKWHCKEFGLIMGLMYILPDTLYSQGMPREWSKMSRFDYYFPEFANLSPQGILNKELYLTGNTTLDNTVFGYQERNSDMRYRHNYITGKLRDFNDLYFSAWTQARHFSETPTLSQSFVTSRGNIRKDFLAVPTEVPFVAEVANIVRAVRPLPYYANPIGL